MPPVLKLQRSRGDKDCALVALKMWTGRDYEDVLVAAAYITKSATPQHRGFSCREILAISRRLRVPLLVKRNFDLDTDEGIVWFAIRGEENDHVAVVKGGLVFGMEDDVWEHELYCSTLDRKATTLLVRKDEQ